MFEHSVRDLAKKWKLLICASRNLMNFHFDVQSRSGMRGIVLFGGLTFFFLCFLAVRAYAQTFIAHYLLASFGNKYNVGKLALSGSVA